MGIEQKNIMPDQITNLSITQELRREGRRLLAVALKAARNNDGSDQAADRLIEKGDPFDAWVAQLRKDTDLSRDDSEKQVTGQLRGMERGLIRREITIVDLLQLAIDSFHKKLDGNRIVLDIEHTPFIFAPTMPFQDHPR